jgi:hypothetical protein
VDSLQIIALCLFVAIIVWLLSAIMRAQAGAKPAPVPSRARKPDPPTEDPEDAKPAAPAAKKVPTPAKPMSPISELLNKAATAPQPLKSSPTPAKPTPVLTKPAEPFRTAKAVPEANAEPAKPDAAKPADAVKPEVKTDDKLMVAAKPAKAPEPTPASAPVPVLFQSQSGRKDTDGASLFAGLKDLDPPAKTAEPVPIKPAEAKPSAEAKPAADTKPEAAGDAKTTPPAGAQKMRSHTAELDDILQRIDKVLESAPPPPVAPVVEATKPDLPAGGGMMMMTESGRITNTREPDRHKTDDDLLRRIDEALAMSNGTSSVAGTMVDPDFAAEASAVAKKDDALDKAETVSGAHAIEKPAEPAPPKVPDWARADALDSDVDKKDAQQKLF